MCAISNHLLAQAKLSTHSKGIMGTKFTILLPDDPRNDSIADIAFAEVERINEIFSTYIPSSEVTHINSTTNWVRVSKDLRDLIKVSEQLNMYTEGAFDIKIGQAINFWQISKKETSLPDVQLINQALSKRRKIFRFGKFVKTNQNTILNFGGIAKGYAVDKAFLKLKEMGYDTLLVDGGGDIRMGEPPFGREGWRIMVLNEPDKMLILKNCAIATSGYDYQNFRIGDIVYSHILDPRTFLSIKLKRGVSIIADDCTTADALATAFSVNPLLEKTRNIYQFKVRIKDDGEYVLKEF